MKPKVTTPPTDMERFVHLFGSERVKQLTNKLEVRSTKDRLDTDISRARSIIQTYNLTLTAQTTGDMARMGAFMVSVPQTQNNSL